MIYAMQNIMEMQKIWWNEFGWTTRVSATHTPRHVRSAAVNHVTASAVVKDLWGQKVGYFHNVLVITKNWGKLLRVISDDISHR